MVAHTSIRRPRKQLKHIWHQHGHEQHEQYELRDGLCGSVREHVLTIILTCSWNKRDSSLKTSSSSRVTPWCRETKQCHTNKCSTAARSTVQPQYIAKQQQRR